MQNYCTSVLFFPSYIETYGLPLKEASLCNAPIIAAANGETKQVIEEAGCGLCCNAGDSYQLADCINNVVNSLDLLATFKQKSIDFASERFDKRKLMTIMSRYLDSIKEN